MNLGKVDGVLPDFIDQFWLRHQSGDTAYQDTCRQTQAVGEGAVHKLCQFETYSGDLGLQVLGTRQAAIGAAAKTRDQET